MKDTSFNHEVETAPYSETFAVVLSTAVGSSMKFSKT